MKSIQKSLKPEKKSDFKWGRWKSKLKPVPSLKTLKRVTTNHRYRTACLGSCLYRYGELWEYTCLPAGPKFKLSAPKNTQKKKVAKLCEATRRNMADRNCEPDTDNEDAEVQMIPASFPHSQEQSSRNIFGFISCSNNSQSNETNNGSNDSGFHVSEPLQWRRPSNLPMQDHQSPYASCHQPLSFQGAHAQSHSCFLETSVSSGFCSDIYNGQLEENADNAATNESLSQERLQNHFATMQENPLTAMPENDSHIPHEARTTSGIEADHGTLRQTTTKYSLNQHLKRCLSCPVRSIPATKVKVPKKSLSSNNLYVTNDHRNALCTDATNKQASQSLKEENVDTETVQDFSPTISTSSSSEELSPGEMSEDLSFLSYSDITSIFSSSDMRNLTSQSEDPQDNTYFQIPFNSFPHTESCQEQCSLNISTSLCKSSSPEKPPSQQIETPYQQTRMLQQQAETLPKQTDTLSQQTKSSVHQTKTPIQQTETQHQLTETPSQQAKTPDQNTETPPEWTETSLQTEPSQQIQTPPQQPKTPPWWIETQVRQTETSSKQTKTPSLQTQTPPQQTETPIETETPIQQIEAQSKQTISPLLETELTPQHIETSSLETELPTETPVKQTEAPLEQSKTPLLETEIPPQHMDTPRLDTEQPRQNIETTSQQTETSVCLQHSKFAPYEYEHMCGTEHSQQSNHSQANHGSSDETMTKVLVGMEPTPDTATSHAFTAVTQQQEETILLQISQQSTVQGEAVYEPFPAGNMEIVNTASSETTSSIASHQPAAEGGTEVAPEYDNQELENWEGLSIRNEPEHNSGVYAAEQNIYMQRDDRLHAIALGNEIQDINPPWLNLNDIPPWLIPVYMNPPWPLPTDIDINGIDVHNFAQEGVYPAWPFPINPPQPIPTDIDIHRTGAHNFHEEDMHLPIDVDPLLLNQIDIDRLWPIPNDIDPPRPIATDIDIHRTGDYNFEEE